jgi:hypothetical protein
MNIITREHRSAPHTRGSVAGIHTVTEQHWDIRYTETEHPRCVLTDSDTPHVSAWPLRGLLSQNTVTNLLGAALVLKYSILRPKISHSPRQPPYTQGSVRKYIG